MPDKTADDAPVWYSWEEASAWINGYNAAIRDLKKGEEKEECSDPF